VTVTTIRLRGRRIATRGLNNGHTLPNLCNSPSDEGGGQVKAELVSVGQSGEQSLKRIESAGERASGGLKGLGRQAELLHIGIRTLGGAFAGVATEGGLAALVVRSNSAANAIGKTADTIGVGVEALQELGFAAKASGVEQQTLDMALQRFTRRAAEAVRVVREEKPAREQRPISVGQRHRGRCQLLPGEPGPDRGRHGARDRSGESQPMIGSATSSSPDNIAY
jgi:hypothetical protein